MTCKYFKNGECKYGAICKYSHTIPNCKFFEKGICKNGNACKYRHFKNFINGNQKQKEFLNGKYKS